MTKEEVYAIVQSIPAGMVMTYGGVARAAGYPRGARSVGRLLHQNKTPFVVPCHRVLFADGSTSPAFVFGGDDLQRQWLESEGVTFIGDKVDMKKHLYFPNADQRRNI